MTTKMKKACIDFSRGKYSDAELSGKGDLIHEKMTGNLAYPTPEPTLDALKAANASFYQACNTAKNGSKESTVIKNNLRAELEQVLRNLGMYVQTASKGDEATILSSGFDVHKQPESSGPLPKPTNLQVKPATNHGSMLLSCGVVKRAISYLFEYRELPATGENSWEQLVSTKHKTQIDGLNSGKQYAFRVAGLNSDPSRNWSDEVSSYVL